MSLLLAATNERRGSGPAAAVRMRLIHWILAILLLIIGLLVWLMLIPGPSLTTGGPHPHFPGMNVGGDGLARLGGGVWIVYALGVAVNVLIVLLVALGVRADHRQGLFRVLLSAVGMLMQYVWWAMYASYLDYLLGNPTGEFLGIPAATAWMLFAVWLTGALLCVVYVVGFRRFIFTEEDEAAYEALRAEAGVPRVGTGEPGVPVAAEDNR